MSNIWFISDEHYNHLNIIKYCNRPFESVEQMNKTLIYNWNSFVQNDDLCYHLGDFCFGNKKQIKDILSRLKGRHFLILGNHDRYKPTEYMEIGFEWASRFPIIYDSFCILSHEHVFLENNSPYCNLCGHTHQNSYQSPKQNYFNCCVEQHNYFPIDYKNIKDHFFKIGFKSELPNDE